VKGVRKAGLLPGILLAMLTLAGCSGSNLTWKTHNIRGLMPDLAFTLTGSDGKTVTQADFKGHVTLLYFGYTHCPDVCPTTVATVVHALRQLKDKAQSVRFLFISVDPKRDTPAGLKTYLQAFDSPELVGLTGTQQQLQALAKRYRVSYSYDKPDANGNYAVNHSAAIFVFDRKGRVSLVMNYRNGADAMAHDLKQMVDGDNPPVRDRETGS